MKILSQREALWATKLLGGSKLTIAKAGCVTTGLSMLSDYYQCFEDPGQIAAHKEYYTLDGLILWDRLRFGKFHFVERIRNFDPIKINSALANPKTAVLLNIWHGSHWVVGLRGGVFGGYVVADPWNGSKITIKASDITGFATFSS